MWWRMSRADWKAVPREEKRERFRAIVEAGPPPGILAYDGDTAVGWCAVGPRETLPQMNRSRVAAPLDRRRRCLGGELLLHPLRLARAKA